MSARFATTDRIDRGGVGLAITQLGDPDAPPIVALHGFPECGHTWLPVADRLADSAVRVVAPDLRAHGSSDAPQSVSSYRMAELLDDVEAVIDAVGSAPARLVGHDWGGALVWLLAQRRPHLLDRAVIINAPHPGILRRAIIRNRDQRTRSSYIMKAQLPRIPEQRLGADRAAALASLFAPPAYDSPTVEHYRAAWTRPGALRGMLNWYRAFARDRSLRPPEGGFDPAITLVWGPDDPVFAPAVVAATETLATDRIRLDGVGHSPHREQPDTVAAIVRDALG